MLAKQPKAIRRTNRAQTGLWWLIAMAGVLVVARNFSSNSHVGNLGDVHSGEYALHRINSNCSLVLSSASGKVETTEFTVGWLGVELTNHQNAHAWLENNLTLPTKLELRLDRRRLDNNGQLQGYFFQRDRLLNEELVRQGFAEPATHPSDFAPIARRIRDAQPTPSKG